MSYLKLINCVLCENFKKIKYGSNKIFIIFYADVSSNLLKRQKATPYFKFPMHDHVEWITAPFRAINFDLIPRLYLKYLSWCVTALSVACFPFQYEDRRSLMTSSNGNIFRITGHLCAGNSPVPGEFPTQRPVTRSFDVYFDLRPDKRLSQQLWGWWFETQSRPLCRHCNVK